MSETRTIVYFGTSAFAVPPLEALLGDGRCRIAAVVSQPDKPAGRRGDLRSCPVAEFARKQGLKLLQPEKLRVEAVRQEIAALAPDLFVVAAYGKILPQSLLTIPRSGALNLHGSLLPNYRGASPIQSAILNGEKKAGVSLMLMDQEMDHGPVFAMAETALDEQETYGGLEAKLAVLAGKLLIDSLAGVLSGELKPREQQHDQATFTKILSRQDGFISWQNESAEEITRKLHAFDPWPGIYAVWERRGLRLRLKILGVKPSDGAEAVGKPGLVFVSKDKNPAVWTRSGALELTEVQVEGKKPASGQALLNGYADLPGKVLASEEKA
jgi:methionyl-tRNA formyltransferase